MSHMNHEPYETLAATYAVGALDGQDLVDFERHLADGCDVCQAALRESAETLATLARSRPPMIPPPAVKEELLRRIAAAPVPRSAARPRPRPLVWAVGTVAAVIAGAAFTGAFVASRYEAQLGVMARETAALRARVEREEAALREQLAVYRSAADLLRDPQAQVVTLRGLGPSPEATARVIWHPANGGYLFVANLPAAPAGKAYELWTIGDAAPQPAGLFQVDASGRAAHRIAPVEGGKPVKVFAVTLEVEGGVPKPEGPMVLASAK
jgi:anti-sigma-K factor RskA